MNSESQYQEQSSEDSCQECRNKYEDSSLQSVSQSEERIVIPVRKQLLQNSNPQLNQMVKKLQIEVESLKRSNIEKDQMIDELKRDMEHKMTHFMLFGEINKQAEQISRLKTEMTSRSREGPGKSVSFKELDRETIRSMVKEEARRYGNERCNEPTQQEWERYYSTTPTARQNNLQKNGRRRDKSKKKDPLHQYYGKNFPGLKISDAKKQIQKLTQKMKVYEEELLWMSNFVAAFIKTIHQIAFKKYQEQILMFDWTLKKKSKVCWRYLKHLLNYLYSS